jgi:hypothetical protein
MSSSLGTTHSLGPCSTSSPILIIGLGACVYVDSTSELGGNEYESLVLHDGIVIGVLDSQYRHV